ncbi:MAG: hypothetical protein AAGF25_05965 [Pseudomonadota bacterium]
MAEAATKNDNIRAWLDEADSARKSAEDKSRKQDEQSKKESAKQAAEYDLYKNSKRLDTGDLDKNHNGIHKSTHIGKFYNSSTEFNPSKGTAEKRRSFLGGEGKVEKYAEREAEGKKTGEYIRTEKSNSFVVGRRDVKYGSENQPKQVTLSTKNGNFSTTYEMDYNGNKQYTNIKVGPAYEKSVARGKREGSIVTEKKYAFSQIADRFETDKDGNKVRTGKQRGAYSKMSTINEDGTSVSVKKWDNGAGFNPYSKTTEKDANGNKRVIAKKVGLYERDTKKLDDGVSELETKKFTKAFKQTKKSTIVDDETSATGKSKLEVTRKKYLGFITKTSRTSTEAPAEVKVKNEKTWTNSAQRDAKQAATGYKKVDSTDTAEVASEKRSSNIKRGAPNARRANEEAGKPFDGNLVPTQRTFKTVPPEKRRSQSPEMKEQVAAAKERTVQKEWDKAGLVGKIQIAAGNAAERLGAQSDAWLKAGQGISGNIPKPPPLPRHLDKSDSGTQRRTDIPLPPKNGNESTSTARQRGSTAIGHAFAAAAKSARLVANANRSDAYAAAASAWPGFANMGMNSDASSEAGSSESFVTANSSTSSSSSRDSRGDTNSSSGSTTRIAANDDSLVQRRIKELEGQAALGSTSNGNISATANSLNLGPATAQFQEQVARDRANASSVEEVAREGRNGVPTRSRETSLGLAG